MKNLLILVDEQDQEVGLMEKLSAHKKGLLHRAFSIFIFNSKYELLLQQRADGKYHSGGLWTNTCCSHPNPIERLEETLERRLKEEMGFESFIQLEFQFKFLYEAKLDNGLIEHEYDYVYFGISDEIPKPASEEVKDWKYINLLELSEELKNHPHRYSEWLKICFHQVLLNSETLKI